MLTVFYAAKGGQGVTTLVAGLVAVEDGPLVVDAAGDLLAALGLAEPLGSGLAGLLAGCWPIAADALIEAAETTPGLPVVPSGGPLDGIEPQRWTELACRLSADRRHWIVDAGTGPAVAMATAADRSLLVTRNCYLALRHATRLTARPTGIVLVREPHRALDHRDIERVVGAPVVAAVEVDSRIARATDAGVASARVPNGLHRALVGLIPHPTGR